MNVLAGLLFSSRPAPPPVWQRMRFRLRTWPDRPVTHWAGTGIALAAHGLPSTPEDLHEKQPVASPDERYSIVWDGRIDNREELLTVLPVSGVTDAALALAAWRHWGREAPAHILGDFAFAIWDEREQELFCVRDPMGWKPLYYAETPSGFAFASELAPLLECFPDPPKRREEMIAEFLTGSFTSVEDTLYQGIFRLPAGQILTARAESIRRTSFWSPPIDRELRYATNEQYAEHFRDLFDQAVRCRLRSCGPVASHISGGIDSTAVSVTASTIQAGTTWQSLSIIYPGRLCDESLLIDEVCTARHLANRQFPGRALPLSYFEQRAAALQDFPGYANFEASSEPVYRHARQSGITVLLSGLGGNQWFEGDTSFLADILVSGRWIESLSKARRLWGRPGTGWIGFWLHNALRPALPPRLRPGWWNWPRPRFPWLQERYLAHSGLPDRIAGYRRQRLLIRGMRPEQATLIERISNPFELQCREYSERGSRHMGVEVRHPFYDRRIVEFALSLPATQRWSGGLSKLIVRNAMRNRIPDSVLNRSVQAEFSSVYADAADFPEWGRTLQSPFLAQRLHPTGRLPIEEQVQRSIANPGQEYFDIRAWRWFALAVWDAQAR